MSNGLDLIIPKGRIIQNVSSGIDPVILKGRIVENVSSENYPLIPKEGSSIMLVVYLIP